MSKKSDWFSSRDIDGKHAARRSAFGLILKHANMVTLNIVVCQQVASPTNHPGSRRQETGLGILWSVHRWTTLATLPRNFTKTKNGPYTEPILLRQGEPDTSQYIRDFLVFVKIGSLEKLDIFVDQLL